MRQERNAGNWQREPDARCRIVPHRREVARCWHRSLPVSNRSRAGQGRGAEDGSCTRVRAFRSDLTKSEQTFPNFDVPDMRVAHIITRLIVGGAQENTLLNCHDLMREFGDQVVLITGPALGPEGSLIGQARDRGIPIEVVPQLRRALHPLRDFRSYRAIARLLRRFGPEVVHTHSGKAGLLGRLAAWRQRVPAIVHTVHGAPFHAYQGRGARLFFRRCEKFAARRCHAIISVADAMTDLMVAAGVAPREKFTTIYSGMEVGPFLAADQSRRAERARWGLAPEHVAIGKVARLFHLKGHADLVEAAKRVVAECPDVRFLLVGDGILREPIERRIREAGLTEHFQFTGLVPPERIAPLLGAMDLVVHASYREGLARVLPQALIAGKPVVSYDIDGAGEVVTDNETGFVVEPGDVPGLAAAMIRLARDRKLRRRLGETGRERCAERFGHEEMSRRIRELYGRLLEQGRGPTTVLKPSRHAST